MRSAPTAEHDRIARAFLDWYATNQAQSAAAAIALEEHISKLLSDADLRVLMVAARAKTLDSVRGKLLRKPYKRPSSQLTDRLGVRVIVFHAREVDPVATYLRQRLLIRESYSSDKRKALGLREFGYRSYHLVASLPDRETSSPRLRSLRRATFEVQIRSLLEHAWAEIEHDVVYKSEANWPRELKRRFAAIAGVLELLEHDFDQLSEAASRLIDDALASLRAQVDPSKALDVPYMAAILELERPRGLSFRAARQAQTPFPPGIEQRLVLALRRSGIASVGALLLQLRAPNVKRRIRKYADLEGVAIEEVSHFALLALMLGTRRPNVLETFFPEFATEPSLRSALVRRR